MHWHNSKGCFIWGISKSLKIVEMKYILYLNLSPAYIFISHLTSHITLYFSFHESMWIWGYKLRIKSQYQWWFSSPCKTCANSYLIQSVFTSFRKQIICFICSIKVHSRVLQNRSFVLFVQCLFVYEVFKKCNAIF